MIFNFLRKEPKGERDFADGVQESTENLKEKLDINRGILRGEYSIDYEATEQRKKNNPKFREAFIAEMKKDGFVPLTSNIATETLVWAIEDTEHRLNRGDKEPNGGRVRTKKSLEMMKDELKKRDTVNYGGTDEAANSSSFPQEELINDQNIFITLSKKAENLEILSDEELATLIQEVTTALKSHQGEQDQELRTSLKGLFSALTDKKYSLEHYSVKKDSQIKTD